MSINLKTEFDFSSLSQTLNLNQNKRLEVKIGHVKMGGNNPIVVQSMTSGSRLNPTSARDIARDELKEIKELVESGSEIVRIALNSEKATEAIPYIKEDLAKNNIKVPLVGCGQYEVADLVNKFPNEVAMLEKLRINPGNVGFGNKRDKKFEAVIEFACKYNIPVRIGVNWGSLDKDLSQQLMDENALSSNPLPSDAVLRKALVLSALLSSKRAEEIGLPSNKIVISCKVSRVEDLLLVYRFLNANSNYALHLGLTEAGMGRKAIVSTSVGVGTLLAEGIGDTIRASLTPKVGEKRSTEVLLCQEILQSLGVRSFSPQVTSCPGCGRTGGNYFQHLTEQVQSYIESNMGEWKIKYKGIENLKVAVMGCVVNGPGESKHSDIGISLPGYGENPVAAVFVDGNVFKKLSGDNIYEEFIQIIIDYIEKKYEAYA